MPIIPSSLEHMCDTLIKQIRKEYPRLRFVCITHKNEKTDQTIIHNRDKIPEALLPAFKHKLQTPTKRIEFAGLLRQTKKKMFGLQTHEHYTAGILINADAFEDPEHAKIELCAQIWKIIKLHEAVQAKNDDAYTEKNNIFSPALSAPEHEKQTMLADAFAGIFLEMTTRKGMMKNVAKYRCELCFEKTSQNTNVSSAFPSALDLTLLVYEDIRRMSTSQKGSPTKTAYLLVEEIDYSFDEAFIRQWQAFIEAAQEMVWADLDLPYILGAAVYTSESAYNRSNAYLVAEILNIDPAPMTEFDGYNPFADIETQERTQKKRCEEQFQALISETAQKNHAMHFYKAAYQQCFDLLEQSCLGWNAHALAAAAFAFESSDNGELSPLESASQSYRKATECFNWDDLRTLHRDIIARKKADQTTSKATLLKVLSQSEGGAQIEQIIKQLFERIEGDADLKNQINARGIEALSKDRFDAIENENKDKHEPDTTGLTLQDAENS